MSGREPARGLQRASSIHGEPLGRERIIEAARRIARAVAGGASSEKLVVVPVLSGAWFFAADLMRLLDAETRTVLEPVSARSYRGTSSGEVDVNLLRLSRETVEGRHIVLVDGILDTGRTLAAIQRLLESFHPMKVETAVLLRKVGCQTHAPKVEHVGFDIDDRFVVGYGMDLDGHHRALESIFWLDESAGAIAGR
jgi:hypoxanthine phosphoribosyltransferase